MKIVALICARGNSQGLKNKNLLKFKKTTLLGNSIRQAFKSKYIQRVVVSTHNEKIIKEAKKNNAEVPFIRPKKLSEKNSPEIDVWRHAIKFLNKKKDINFIVSVPATAPLRKVEDIDRCITKAIRENLDIVFTGTMSSKNPFFNIVRFKKKKLYLASKSNKKIFRRQDAPKCFDLTTACYVFKPEYIMRIKNLLSGKTGIVIIPKERATDIDDIIDYKIAQFLSNKK